MIEITRPGQLPSIDRGKVAGRCRNCGCGIKCEKADAPTNLVDCPTIGCSNSICVVPVIDITSLRGERKTIEEKVAELERRLVIAEQDIETMNKWLAKHY